MQQGKLALYNDNHFAIFLQTSEVSNPLGDERFSAMFSNPDFQVDEESEVRTGTGLYSEKYLHDVGSRGYEDL